MFEQRHALGFERSERAVGCKADFDADGMTELLRQNTVTGEVVVWLMNGTSVRTSVYTSPSAVTDLAWRIVAPK